jgi:hypothetical protein
LFDEIEWHLKAVERQAATSREAFVLPSLLQMQSMQQPLQPPGATINAVVAAAANVTDSIDAAVATSVATVHTAVDTAPSHPPPSPPTAGTCPRPAAIVTWQNRRATGCCMGRERRNSGWLGGREAAIHASAANVTTTAVATSSYHSP